MAVLPELRATIYYLTPEEGGRKTAVRTGYRGQFYYDGRNWDASQTFINKEWVHVFRLTGRILMQQWNNIPVS